MGEEPQPDGRQWIAGESAMSGLKGSSGTTPSGSASKTTRDAARTAAPKGVPNDPGRMNTHGKMPGGGGTPSGRQPASINELASRLGAIQGVDEDTANFIAQNWSKLLGSLVIVMLIIVVSHKYRDALEARRGSAAEQFADIRQLYESLVVQRTDGSPEESSPEAKEPAKPLSPEAERELEAKFTGKLPALENTDRGNIYGSFAGLYRVAEQLRKKDVAGARESLAKTRVADYTAVKKVLTISETQATSLPEELGALLAARTELLDGKLDRAGEMFARIVRGARFANLEALIALKRMAELPNSPVRLDSVRDLSTELLAARPELREVVTKALQEQGLALASAS